MQLTNYKTILFCAAMLAAVSSQKIYCQAGPGTPSFRAPLDISLLLSGNFGEVRSNHFHSGLDFKTNGQSGLPVRATLDGYVSRIKVEPGGYGKALYITHPGGYTSVYGHLQEFDMPLSEYVTEQQYGKESFRVDLFPPAERFSYREGDIIGLSGNSGSSMGPHLHFEIRDSQTENPLNPLLFPFKVKDDLPPVIYEIRLYSLPNDRNELRKPLKFQASGSSGNYYLGTSQPLPVDSLFGIGVETLDFLNGSSNRCGVYSIKVYLDDDLYFHSQIDEFSFAESRYINSFIDYADYRENRNSLYKTFIDPNNHLSIFQFAKNKGIIELKDSGIHNIHIEVTDVSGNESSIRFRVRKNSSRTFTQPEQMPLYNAYFHYAEENIFEDDKIRVEIPSKALYNNIFFRYETLPAPVGCYSRIHRVHKDKVPLHKSYKLSIEPDSLPARLRPYALIAKADINGYSSIGGKWEGDRLVTSTRSFGDFTIKVDTVPPVIKPGNFSNGNGLLNLNQIRFTIYDDFTGISDYRGTIDGRWVLFEWDPKNRLLFYDTGKKPLNTSAPHLLKLVVTDGVGNKSEYSLEIK